MKLIIAWIKGLYLLANADSYYCRKGGGGGSSNLVEEKLEETINNNTCGWRHSQHHNAHLS